MNSELLPLRKEQFWFNCNIKIDNINLMYLEIPTNIFISFTWIIYRAYYSFTFYIYNICKTAQEIALDLATLDDSW